MGENNNTINPNDVVKALIIKATPVVEIEALSASQ